jgi:hypothetical protein
MIRVTKLKKEARHVTLMRGRGKVCLRPYCKWDDVENNLAKFDDLLD